MSFILFLSMSTLLSVTFSMQEGEDATAFAKRMVLNVSASVISYTIITAILN
jgi:hypothetical protein